MLICPEIQPCIISIVQYGISVFVYCFVAYFWIFFNNAMTQPKHRDRITILPVIGAENVSTAQ